MFLNQCRHLKEVLKVVLKEISKRELTLLAIRIASSFVGLLVSKLNAWFCVTIACFVLKALDKIMCTLHALVFPIYVRFILVKHV